MARIAVAGFLHETNTFAPHKAEWEDFVRAEGFPGLTLGDEMLAALAPINVGAGGFIREAQTLGHTLLPIGWCAAVPSAHVSSDAFENMSRIILDGLAERRPIDALYLDLHGAMVSEHYDDGEGELLTRVRAALGAELPVVVSLDLHANTTPAMLDSSDGLIAYRTYPHLDMADTGRRAARYLDALLRGSRPAKAPPAKAPPAKAPPAKAPPAKAPPAKARRALPFLIPLTGQCTMVEPTGGVYRYLEELEDAVAGLRSLSFTPGFPPADIYHCGPVVVAYADDQAAADRAADALYDYILEREDEFAVPMLSPDEAVVKALGYDAGKPVVLADVQDNSGAGATSDTTGLLAALVRHDAAAAALGVLTDPEAAAAAHAAGTGAEIDIAVGGKRFKGDPPFAARWRVDGLSDGRFRCTGPFYRNIDAELGPMAVLRHRGVSVVVASGRMQAADQAMFRHIGVEPTTCKILGLKSAVHFRGDFTDISADILIVEAPGAFIDRPERLPYRKLRAGVRTRPNGRTRG